MHTIGAYDAKTHLSEILDKVTEGEKYVITKHGVPVAQIIPMLPSGKVDPVLTIQKIKNFRKGKTLGKLKIKEMINEGRRGC
ncbi:MAG: type II toxin-antitoxin system prevent-host-death family antitoxin [bacterium]